MTARMETELYLVIATDGRRVGLLEQTLSSIRNCNIPDSVKGLFLIQNGDSQSVLPTLDASFPIPIIFSHLKRANKSAALNTVLERVDSGLLYFFDDDVIVTQQALVAMDQAGKLHREGAFFGGPVEVRFDQPPPDWLRPYLPLSVNGWRLDTMEVCSHDKPQFLGFNWAARAEDLRKVGGFSARRGPGQFASGQETFAQEGLMALGLTGYYVPQAVVVHYAPAQNCTPAFALMRTHRSAVYQGLRSRGAKDTINTLVLTLLVALRAAILYTACVLKTDTKGMFHHKLTIGRKLGVLKGMCLRLLYAGDKS